MVRSRRWEDQDLQVLLARPARLEEGSSSAAGRFRLSVEGASRRRETVPELQPMVGAGAYPEGTVLVLDLGADDALLMAGAMMRRIPRGTGGRDLLDHAAMGAAAWRDERLRAWKRSQLPDKLIAFAEQLNAAETIADVCAALTKHALCIVDGYDTRLLIRDEVDAVFREVDGCSGRVATSPIVLPATPRFGEPGLLTVTPAAEDPYLSTLCSLHADGVAIVAHIPVGEDALLLLLERRDDRIFSHDDWELLRTLADQSDATLKRLRLLEDVRRLSLSDPLTGLANRRRMQIVLEHAWAAAERGEPLALAVIDLDGFKAINDQFGHLEGDRVLCAVADALKAEVRDADLAVRYGGDEFVVILPLGSEEGAEALVRRVRSRLQGVVEISHGVAAHHPGVASVKELIGIADARLYRAKNGGNAGATR